MDLNIIKQAISRRDFEQVENGFITILNHINIHGFNQARKTANGVEFVGEKEISEFANHFVMTVSELLTIPTYEPSVKMIEAFISNKMVVDSMFLSSIWGSSDPLLEKLLVTKKSGKGQVTLSGKNFNLLMMLISVPSKFKFDWSDLARKSPHLAVTNFIALMRLSHYGLTKEGSESLERLCKQAENMPMFNYLNTNQNIAFMMVVSICSAYFMCSNYDIKSKYVFKKYITDLLKFSTESLFDVSQYTVEKKPLVKSTGKKLKVLIMLEKYTVSHAMFRCYNAPFQKLAEEYELIAFGEFKDVDDKELFGPFSRVEKVVHKLDIEPNMKKVKEIAPDIIYYASIGMSGWGIHLSQFRLAPLQLMTGGHPASSMSDCIDYMMVPLYSKYLEGMQEHFCEKVVSLEDDSEPYYYDLHPKAKEVDLPRLGKYLEFDDSKPIRIAINGVIHKINDSLLDVCTKIEQKAGRKIEYVVFNHLPLSKSNGIALKKLVTNRLKNVDFYYAQSYENYLETIASCHFCLPTYPFGGNNSNLDAMLINKPKLYIRGTESLYTRLDRCDWGVIGLDEDLGCDSLEELIDKSVEFINNPGKLKVLYDKIKRADVINNRIANEKNTSKGFLRLFNQCVESSY